MTKMQFSHYESKYEKLLDFSLKIPVRNIASGNDGMPATLISLLLILVLIFVVYQSIIEISVFVFYWNQISLLLTVI